MTTFASMSDDAILDLLEAQVRGAKAMEELSTQHPRYMLDVLDSESHLSFLKSTHMIRVAATGNGWGKTTMGAADADMFIQGDDPWKAHLIPPWPRVVVWFTKKFQQFAIIREDIERKVFTKGWKWNEQKKCYTWPNGGKLFVFSSESEWESVQGIQPDLVIWDEHPNRGHWKEMMFRRRAKEQAGTTGKYRCRYAVLATMTEGITWFVRDVIQDWEKHHKNLGLSNHQARLQQLHPKIWLWDQGGIADNPSMDSEDIQHYMDQQDQGAVSDGELTVRVSGGYADFTANPVFDGARLIEQKANLREGVDVELELIGIDQLEVDDHDSDWRIYNRLQGMPVERVDQYVRATEIPREKALEDYEAGSRPNRTTIYEPPDPMCTYVAGSDHGAGIMGKAYDTLVVCKITGETNLRGVKIPTLEQVAEIERHDGGETFAEPVYKLLLYYFGAFYCGERQYGLECMRRLAKPNDLGGYGYSYQYYNRDEVKRGRPISDSLGYFRSGSITDLALGDLRRQIRHGLITIRSATLLQQLREMQWKARSKSADWSEVTDLKDLKIAPPDGGFSDLALGCNYALVAAMHAESFMPEDTPYRTGTYGEMSKMHENLGGKDPGVYIHDDEGHNLKRGQAFGIDDL